MGRKNIIGRPLEIEELEARYNSDKSEFIAIYGRRRVGKSYLITETFEKRIIFSVVGTYVKEEGKSYETYRQIQLAHFYDSLLLAGLAAEYPAPTSWREAFALLRKLLQSKRSRRKVIFIDELPWLAGPQSGEMISELGYFWNSWADRQRNIVLIVCGSATSWMLDNVIHDYGGLHGRLTKTILLKQFTLSECEQFYKSRGFRLSRYEMCVCYMAIGGIPYYLDKLQKGKTITQNIDELFFADENIHQEFRDVYTGLYSSKERYVDIVKTLGDSFYGLTQADISHKTGIKSGGTLSKMLENLESSGIIREYPRYGKQRVETVYQLQDFFSLFYLRFVSGCQPKAGRWISLQRTSSFYVWAGDSFELLCIGHMNKMAFVLGIASIDNSYCWRKDKTEDSPGAQVDWVMEWTNARADYLLEMKFSEDKYGITADYEQNLSNKVSAFVGSKMHDKVHSVQLVMVTTFGLTQSEHNRNVNASITLDSLF